MDRNVGFLTSDIARLIRKRFDGHARDYGATGQQWRVLGVVNRFPGMNQGALAEFLDVEPITTCRMVDRLEQAGMIERRRDPDDRRAWQLYLTEAAMPFVASMRDKVKSLSAEAFAGFSDEEQTELIMQLERIRQNLAGDIGPVSRNADHGRG